MRSLMVAKVQWLRARTVDDRRRTILNTLRTTDQDDRNHIHEINIVGYLFQYHTVFFLKINLTLY